jgi:hypothetical protein
MAMHENFGVQLEGVIGEFDLNTYVYHTRAQTQLQVYHIAGVQERDCQVPTLTTQMGASATPLNKPKADPKRIVMSVTPHVESRQKPSPSRDIADNCQDPTASTDATIDNQTYLGAH